mgnify:FL=1
MDEKTGNTNFIWLTLALIGMLLTGAFTRELPDALTLQILEFSSVILMLVSLGSLSKNRGWLIRLATIIGIMLMVVLGKRVFGFQYFEYFYLSLLLLFFMSAAWLVGRGVLLTGSVDLNKIVGSVALYLLLGLIWAIFYTVLLEFSPEAIKGMEAGHWTDNLSIMTYFSFVTLATLGYGDISPVTPVAQTLVILEAVTGMFYMAVVVASLIGGLKRGGSPLDSSH